MMDIYEEINKKGLTCIDKSIKMRKLERSVENLGSGNLFNKFMV